MSKFYIVEDDSTLVPAFIAESNLERDSRIVLLYQLPPSATAETLHGIYSEAGKVMSIKLSQHEFERTASASEYSHADGSIKYHKSLYLHSNGDICMFLSSTPPHTSTCTESRRKQMRAMCYETCRNQMIKDVGNEGPLWKLTCYGHVNYGPCDIVGDTSYEELRALAYKDAKSGLCLEAIVERERCSLMVMLCKFDGALTSRKHRLRCCSPPPQEVPWTIPTSTSESKENISSTGTVAEITNYTSRIMPPLTNLENIQSSIFPKGLNAASFEINGSNASQKAQNLIKSGYLKSGCQKVMLEGVITSGLERNGFLQRSQKQHLQMIM